MNREAPPLLEREEPQRRLEASLNAARRKQGRIISIEGEAGIGKTTLVLRFADAHRLDTRVYLGGCENLATPEPLGPLRDIARDSRGKFALTAGGQIATFEALLRFLTDGREPALLIIEDLHWADDPTLDLLRFLGRRIRTAPILTVVTFRNDDSAAHARLASLWADLPRDCRERAELSPLSLTAVSVLSTAAGRTPREVFDATGGNPFHVTEYLASTSSAVPHSVRDATLVRAARMSARARRALDCAAIFPRRIDEQTLRVLAVDTDHAGVEECLRCGMLNVTEDSLAFRHDLARRAIHDAMSPLRRRELHAAALAFLKERRHGHSAEIAHHAEQAGAVGELVDYSVRAAREAVAMGARREAVAHLARALKHGVWLSDAERAELLEQQAEAGEQCGEFEAAQRAIGEAVAARKQAGDPLGLGNALRISARLHWQLGRPADAEQLSQEALHVMRDHRDTWQYAMALSGQSQLDMLADRYESAIARSAEAMASAERLLRSDIYLHALTNASAARSATMIKGGFPEVVAAIAEAQRRNRLDYLPRMYSNLAYMMMSDRNYPELFRYLEEGIHAAVAHDNAPLEAYMRGIRAMALLDLGRAQEAIVEADSVLCGPYPHGTIRFTAQLALARARVRLGLREGGVLDEARALPTAQRDLMRMAPLAVVDAEALWLEVPTAGALERLRAAFAAATQLQGQRWALADTALWLTILGEPLPISPELLRRMSSAHQLHVTGRWREAAQAWHDTGCPYEQAIALAMGDEAAQRDALAIFDRLGAAPAARKLRRELRKRGVRAIPSGPRAARRNDPAGLTPRQNQVLGLLAEGLSNAAIAVRLTMSAKTVEHHVGAVLAALEAPSRLRAVQIARERGLLQGPQN
ncbi:MAG TPA: AAA family ATPase [Steroidobacteraceae bacterium]|nr:AAA family ATPase [Steroidobacteraceae bacterium]